MNEPTAREPNQKAHVLEHVKRWLDRFVIELNLCPFAKRERVNNAIRFVVTETTTTSGLLDALAQELDHLTCHSEVATTLLVHPQALNDFDDYNQFLNEVDALLEAASLDGIYQVASFHPDYQFADTQSSDAENYTNRSPYPMIHILRETSVETAVARHPNAHEIPTTNIAKLRSIGTEALKERLKTIAG